jgi:uncharacterized membrane protein YeaQ/YmgE (transglycosylase-associated protein family)
MTLQALILWLIIGGIAGFLAGNIMKSGGLALTGNAIVDNIITGIVGAFIGGWLLGAMGVSIGGGIIAAILNALIGAILLIFGLRLLRRA